MGADPLFNVEAYDAWAETYPPLPHNPLMRAEQQALLSLWPAVRGRRALDLACGTGRYARLLHEAGAASVVATDLSAGMLQRAPVALRVRADMMRLPFRDASFDLVVSGLAIGHARRLECWLREAARVLVAGGVIVCSDFHPAAAAAGMTRSFNDRRNRRHTLLHASHDLAAHRAAAAACGLQLQDWREVRVGEQLCEAFEGSDAFYARWQGLPVVLAVRLGKPE